MGFLSRLTAMVRRDDPLRYLQIIPLDNPAGIAISTDVALQLSTVWACIMAISNAMSVSRWNIRTAMRAGGWQMMPDDPLDYVLNTRPNPDMTAIAFREASMFNVLTWGNAYAEIARDGSGRAKELWPLMPHRVVPQRNFETGELYYEYYQQDGGKVIIPQADMFHLKGPGITGLMGDHLVARMAKSLGLALAQERFASTYFGNNTIIGGYLKYPKAMDDRTFDHVRQSWADRHKGPDKAHKPAILEGGAEWIPFTNNAEQAQLTLSRKFTVEEICRWFGVPPHKVQHLDRSTYNNIEQQALEFIRDACTPWARRWEQEVDYKLLSVRKPARSMLIDMAPLTQGDFKTRMEGYAIGRQWGIYTANEVRLKEGENPIGAEGEIRIVPLNMQPSAQLLNAKEPPIFEYHIKAGIPTVNEVRERLALPPAPNGDMPANQIPPGQAAPSHDAVEKPAPKVPAPPPGASTDDSLPPAADEKPTKAVRRVNMAVEACATLLFSAFEHYGRCLTNRAIDLRRANIGGKKFDGNMADLRVSQRPVVLRDCQPALELALKIRRNEWDGIDSEREILYALDMLDNGMAPIEVSERLTARLLAKAPTPLPE